MGGVVEREQEVNDFQLDRSMKSRERLAGT
jgi:hypothetical protein